MVGGSAGPRAAVAAGPEAVANPSHRGSTSPCHHVSTVKRDAGPLLVYGPRSPTYDFGPAHPLTPRRFGPGIDLLRAVEAEPGYAPEPAPDTDLLRAHTAGYIAAVRRFSDDPFGLPEAGIGEGGDNPPFPGMHDAAAAVADGSVRGVEAILRGDVEHAFHPGGGLHHAMADRAAGFCIYDDPALAIARARADGLRVLYVDLDVHHGDGVQSIFWDDPGVLTVSFHESGRYLFPGTGAADELGQAEAAGTSVNVPFEPFAGETAWLAAVRSLVPLLAASFGPDLVVSQHGADSHAWDPLAHLRNTTTAMGEAARLVDATAHRWAGGRWLSTGGGGYDAYRVVPRSWSLVWLAGAHRDVPDATPVAWRERWAAEAARFGQVPLPERFEDEPNAGERVDEGQRAAEGASRSTVAAVRDAVVPALLREAEGRGWWSPLDPPPAQASASVAPPSDGPVEVVNLDGNRLSRLRLAGRVMPPADAAVGWAILERAVESADVTALAAIAGDVIVGVAIVSGTKLVALGVTPARRRQGIARELVDRLARTHSGTIEAVVTVAERDPMEPLPHRLRMDVARDIFERAGFEVTQAGGGVRRIDPSALLVRRP